MAKYIDMEAARNSLYEADAITMNGVAMLNNFPAADVVEVVRCRDCIFKCREVSGELYVVCERNDYTEFPMDGFCCYGKRRKENG